MFANRRVLPALRGCVRAAALVGAPTVVLALLRDGAGIPIPTFVLIVPLAAAAWSGGFSEGVVASLTVFVLTNYLDVEPHYAFTYSLTEIPRLVLILAIGLLGASRGRAERRRSERAAQQYALARIAAAALESPITTTAELAVRLVVDTLQIPHAFVLQKGAGDRGRLLASVGAPADTLRSIDWQCREDAPPARDVMVFTEPREPLPRELVTVLHGLGDRPSAAITSLASGGTLHGLLAVATPERRTFRPFELEWLQSVGYVLAAAMERARLDGERTRALDEAQMARDAAERANRAKDEFLATLSHELRTPLNVLMGWVAVLRNNDVTPERREKAVNALERNAQAQFRLVQDLLDTSQIISGKLHLNLQRTPIAEVLQSAIETVLPTAEAKQVTLTMAGLDPESEILGDALRLRQAVWNVLNNAVKFTPRGGSVRLAFTVADGDAVIAITDSGIGIEPAFLPRIFDRFSQADGTTTRDYGGLGLGLAIVQHIVELHGGRVTASSEGRGCGATFTLLLPLAPTRTRQPDQLSGPSAGGAQSRSC